MDFHPPILLLLEPTGPVSAVFPSLILLLLGLVSVFLAILFLQSGLDKVFNWSGNLGWLKDHFKNSPLRSMVPLLLGIITVVEVLAGAACAVGLIPLFFGNWLLVAAGIFLSALSLIFLFFGQRMAQDYAGAGALVPYFLLTLFGLLLLYFVH